MFVDIRKNEDSGWKATVEVVFMLNQFNIGNLEIMSIKKTPVVMFYKN